MKETEIKLEIEELEERIAPTTTSLGKAQMECI
jgi:hypothetical protein